MFFLVFFVMFMSQRYGIPSLRSRNNTHLSFVHNNAPSHAIRNVLQGSNFFIPTTSLYFPNAAIIREIRIGLVLVVWKIVGGS